MNRAQRRLLEAAGEVLSHQTRIPDKQSSYVPNSMLDELAKAVEAIEHSMKPRCGTTNLNGLCGCGNTRKQRRKAKREDRDVAGVAYMRVGDTYYLLPDEKQAMDGAEIGYAKIKLDELAPGWHTIVVDPCPHERER